MLREWVDAVLFANYNTMVETGQDKVVRAKAGNRRMLYTSHTAAYDAKNSYGLPDEIPMDYEQLCPYIEASYAGKITYSPAPQSQEELIAKKRYQAIAIVVVVIVLMAAAAHHHREQMRQQIAECHPEIAAKNGNGNNAR